MTTEEAVIPQPTEPTPDPKPPKRTRSPQDLIIINRVNELVTRLTAAKTNANVLTPLAARGYDAPGLDEGLATGKAALAAINAMDAAIDDRRTAASAVRQAEKAARAGFDAFRQISKGIFKDDPDAKAAVKATGRIPTDQQLFLSYADSAYETAGKRQYLSKLSKRGYDAAGLQAERAKLTALQDAIAAFRAADDAKKNATRQRNAAVKNMDRWWTEFKAVAAVCLQDQPQWKSELGL